MRSSPDPSLHRQRERQFIEHVEKLLDDERLRVDTARGRYPVTSLIRDVARSDRGVDLKRHMAQLGKPDRELESRMPRGESLEVTLAQPRWIFLTKPVGRMKVVCVSPVQPLLSGEAPQPLAPAEVKRVLSEIPPPLGNVPVTVVLMSTSGFTIEAREAIERRIDRTVIFVEPNDAGGWSVYGPTETKALTDLFDPEAGAEKRQRVRDAIDADRAELLTSGIATDRLASRTQLPLQIIEEELKSYARENPGLVVKRLDGRGVLFRQGSAAPAGRVIAGGSQMPFLERIKAVFARKGDTEKKVELLSEERAALSQKRDRAYEDMAVLEQQEAELRRQFKESDAALAKRRITSQLLQLRKDIERRQQLLGVVNQQINVVSTHLHNLELVQQGRSAKMPTTEQLTADAEAAEKMLAELEVDHELAASVGATAHGSMTAEEQALYEELERESASEPAAETPPVAQPEAAAIPRREKEKPSPQRATRKPAEPEAG